MRAIGHVGIWFLKIHVYLTRSTANQGCDPERARRSRVHTSHRLILFSSGELSRNGPLTSEQESGRSGYRRYIYRSQFALRLLSFGISHRQDNFCRVGTE